MCRSWCCSASSWSWPWWAPWEPCTGIGLTVGLTGTSRRWVSMGESACWSRTKPPTGSPCTHRAVLSFLPFGCCASCLLFTEEWKTRSTWCSEDKHVWELFYAQIIIFSHLKGIFWGYSRGYTIRIHFGWILVAVKYRNITPGSLHFLLRSRYHHRSIRSMSSTQQYCYKCVALYNCHLLKKLKEKICLRGVVLY